MADFIHTIDAKGATSQRDFVSQSEREFHVRARRNRLLADWTCDLTDEDNQAYLRLLLDVDFAKVESADAMEFLLVKILNDLMGFGVFLPMTALKDVYARFESQARDEPTFSSPRTASRPSPRRG